MIDPANPKRMSMLTIVPDKHQIFARRWYSRTSVSKELLLLMSDLDFDLCDKRRLNNAYTHVAYIYLLRPEHIMKYSERLRTILPHNI